MAKVEVISTVPEVAVPDVQAIKAAILSHCGGWLGASDGEFIAKWRSLPPETQAEYMRQKTKEA